MDFVKGMDLSLLRELEDRGAVFRLKGNEMDLFTLMKKCSVNLIRLRLWVNPYSKRGESYGGGMNDIATTIELARRTINAGMSFMLDFHYSDFWADPAKQFKPKAWKYLEGDALREQVYEYTKRVLCTLRDENLIPEFIQIGNEITNGFLWPDGKFENTETMVSLLRAGIQGAREILPSANLIIHLDYGTDNEMYRKWFKAIEPYDLDFDVVGMSYYPHWNGSIEKLSENMNDISQQYDKDVMVVETSIAYTLDTLGCEGIVFGKDQEKASGYPSSKEGQRDFLSDLIDAVKQVKDRRGIGVVYWEPEWLPIPECTWSNPQGQKYMKETVEAGNANGNQALFDLNGNANPALLELRNM